MATTLGDLAQVAALFAGVHQQRKDARRTRREELAFRNAQQEIARQQLAYQQHREEARRKQEETDQALRQAEFYKQGLFGPNAPDFLANLAQQGPQVFEGYVRSAGDALKRAGVPFDPSAFLIQPPAAPGAPARPSEKPAPLLEEVAPMMMGAERPALTTPRMAPPEKQFGLAGLPPLNLQLPQMERPQNVEAQVQPPAAPPFDLAGAYRQRYRPSVKTQAGVDRVEAYRAAVAAGIPVQQARAILLGEQAADLAAFRNPKIARLQAETAKALADEDFRRVATLVEELKAETERTKPALNRAITRNISDLPVSREKGRQVTVRGQDVAAATTRRGQDITAATAAANRANRIAVAGIRAASKSGAANQVPAGSRPFVQKLAGLATAKVREASGSERFLSDDERAAKAAQINAEHQRAFGVPLFGAGGVLSEGSVRPSAGGGGRGGAARDSNPAPGGGGAPTEAQVQMIGALSAAEYAQRFKQAPEHLKGMVRSARAEAVRRGMVKGGR